jgi:hypothetical protein
MTRVGHILKGLCALGLLAGIAAGIPWALWHFIGWPLPHHVPSLAQLGHALDQRGIPDQALIDALAAVVWVTWAVLIASIAVEVPAALAGRRAPGSLSPGSSNRSPAGSSPLSSSPPSPSHLARPK